MRKNTESKIPHHCSECEHFLGATSEWGKKYGMDTCTAQNHRAPTYSFANPLDTPMPPVINCIYMEQNHVFRGLPDRKKIGYLEEQRLKLQEIK